MIITIDGPAGTGKSSVARSVAQRLSFDFLDTGAMYRAVALEALRRQVNLEDVRALGYVGRHCRIEFDWTTKPPALTLNGERVSHLIRTADVTRAASCVAVVPAIRQQLVGQQRQIGQSRTDLVSEGRDQGSVVFPDAAIKFYLDASPQERARRRAAQLRARGEHVEVNELLREIIARDQRDSTRSIAPMVIPKGATVIDTTPLSEQQVVDRIVAEVQARQPA